MAFSLDLYPPYSVGVPGLRFQLMPLKKRQNRFEL